MISFLVLILCPLMIGTSFLSGIFGMAGGMILIGVLLALMPVPDAMMLHGVTQLASNGWRGLLWVKYARWRMVASYIIGCAIALLLWSLTRYVPSKPIALLMLGLTPFMVQLAPQNYRPDPESTGQGMIYGTICMALVLLTGVSGPLIDTFFLGGKLDRREIVATKAMCQIFVHAAKLLYFGFLTNQAASIEPIEAVLAVACSMIGTTLAAKVSLIMSDQQYRAWAKRIIATIAAYYVAHGSFLTLMTELSAR